MDHSDTEVTDICDAIYANVEELKSETKDEAGQQTPGGPQGVKSSCRATAKCLGLLCVLLLSGIIGLSVHYITVTDNHHSEMQNLRISYENLTAAQKQLQTNYSILTEERDRLQTGYVTLTRERDTLTKERDRLQASSNDLIKEKDQLQSRYDTVSASRDDLQLEVNRLKLRQNCPQGWRKFGCSCYYISSARKTWQESRDDCVSKGAHLVIINSGEEQTFLRKLAVRAWIGLSDTESEGQWKWVNGDPLVGEGFWMKGEPNDQSGSEDCGELIVKQGAWNDLTCTIKQLWICEKVIGNQ